MKKYIIILIFLLSSFTKAKDISIEETVNFLKSKLDVFYDEVYEVNGKKFSLKNSQSFIDNGNCNFTIRKENIGMRNINKKLNSMQGFLKTEYIFDAKKLDYTKVYRRASNSSSEELSMGTTENKENILMKSYIYEPSYPSYCKKEEVSRYGGTIKVISSKECVTTYFEKRVIISMILRPKEDNRPRVIKAMKHLIKMCGGKEELF